MTIERRSRSQKARMTAIGALLLVAQTLALAHPAAAATGDLDHNFGDDGISAPVYDGTGWGGRSLAIQSDGKVVAVGFGDVAARYTGHGRLDPSFNGTGVSTSPIARQYSQYDTWAREKNPQVVIQVDDGVEKVVVAGADMMGQASVASAPLRLWRFGPDGTLDDSFGVGGIVTDEIGMQGRPASLHTFPDGRFLQVATWRPDGERWCFFLSPSCAGGTTPAGVVVVRTPVGLPDPTFGAAGRTIVRPSNATHVVMSDAAIQADGKILVVGEMLRAGGGGWVSFVTRLLPTGTPDPVFGVGGSLVLDANPMRGAKLAVDEHGSIFVAGRDGCHTPYYDYEDCRVRVVRLSLDGDIETSFQSPAFSERYQIVEPSVAALLIDGDRVIVATAEQILRFTSDGQLDPGFGTEGVVDLSATYRLNDAALEADGKITTTGQLSAGMVVARHMNDGTTSEPPPPEPPAMATLDGQVGDQKSKWGIPYATVDCGDGFVTTADDQGWYRIESIPEGSRNCTASAPGYQPKKERVDVIAPSTRLHFELRKGR